MTKSKTPLPARGVPVNSPLVLVGWYQDRDRVNRAVVEFEAASFGIDDAVFVRRLASPHDSWWTRLRGWYSNLLEDPPTGSSPVPILIEGAEELLAAGGGFVLVRCPARFQQACDIIERTGGRVGMARPIAA